MFNLSRVVHRDELFDMLSQDTTLFEKLSCTVTATRVAEVGHLG